MSSPAGQSSLESSATLPASLLPDLEVRVGPRGSTAASAAKPLTVMTDDQGRYRAFGLPAGTYVVAARPRTSTSDIDVPADADVDATLAALRERRGVTAPPSPVPAKPKAATNFAPVYHPSELTLDAGTGVAVTASEERSGIDITLRLLSTCSVWKRGNRRRRNQVADSTDADDAVCVFGPGHPDDNLDPDGAFRFPNVAPGQYRLSAQALTAEARRASLGLSGAQGTGPCAFSSQDFTVTSADVTALSVVMRPCLTIAGRIALGGNGETRPDVSKLVVALMQLGPHRPRCSSPFVCAPPAIAMDGTDQLRRVRRDSSWRVSVLSHGSRQRTRSRVPPAVRGCGRPRHPRHASPNYGRQSRLDMGRARAFRPAHVAVWRARDIGETTRSELYGHRVSDESRLVGAASSSRADGETGNRWTLLVSGSATGRVTTLPR